MCILWRSKIFCHVGQIKTLIRGWQLVGRCGWWCLQRYVGQFGRNVIGECSRMREQSPVKSLMIYWLDFMVAICSAIEGDLAIQELDVRMRFFFMIGLRVHCVVAWSISHAVLFLAVFLIKLLYMLKKKRSLGVF